MDNLLCEVRFVDDSTRQTPGTLSGTLLTYGQRARFKPEIVERGALYWDGDNLPVNRMHQRGEIFARFAPIVDGDTIRIETPLPNTTRARDAATDVRDGVLTGLSVEMLRSSIVARYVNGVRHITKAQLVGAGLVDLAEYDTTVDVRHADGLAVVRVGLICL